MYVKLFQNSDESLVNLHKNGVVHSMLTDVVLQNLPEIKISKEKYDDLMQLLKYVPVEYHDFYKKIAHKCESDGDYSLVDESDEE